MTPVDRLLAHPDIARLARRLAARPGIEAVAEGHERYAAIALVVRAGVVGEPELLMIKRAEFDGDPWSGHIACPGGRAEPADRDLESTAIRETWEETGVDLGRDGRILGTLDDMSPRSSSLPPLIIRPFVAAVRSDVALLHSGEVADAFWVPISAIRERTAWGMGFVEIHGVGATEVDVFRHGSHIVWGLTHRALRQFTDLLDEDGADLP